MSSTDGLLIPINDVEFFIELSGANPAGTVVIDLQQIKNPYIEGIYDGFDNGKVKYSVISIVKGDRKEW